MTDKVVKRITPMSENTYEVVLVLDEIEHTAQCTVTYGRDVPLVSFKPNPLHERRYTDTRPIAAEIIAVHQARRSSQSHSL